MYEEIVRNAKNSITEEQKQAIFKALREKFPPTNEGAVAACIACLVTFTAVARAAELPTQLVFNLLNTANVMALALFTDASEEEIVSILAHLASASTRNEANEAPGHQQKGWES